MFGVAKGLILQRSIVSTGRACYKKRLVCYTSVYYSWHSCPPITAPNLALAVPIRYIETVRNGDIHWYQRVVPCHGTTMTSIGTTLGPLKSFWDPFDLLEPHLFLPVPLQPESSSHWYIGIRWLSIIGPKNPQPKAGFLCRIENFVEQAKPSSTL